MSIDASGLTTKRYEDIKAELEASLRSYLGNDLDLTEDSVFGIINIIYANAVAEQWEMAEAVYNAFNVDVATGKQLDDLVAIVGLTRLDESPTTGIVELKGDEGTVIAGGSEFKTSTTDISVYLEEDVLIGSSNCSSSEIEVTNLIPAFNYVLNINGKVYSYTASGVDTVQTLLLTINDIINFDTSSSWISVYDGVSDFLEVRANNITYPMSIVLSANIDFKSISSVGQASTITNGDIVIFEDTVTTIETPVTGLLSVNNPLNFSTGRFKETDDELRLRQSTSTSIIGSSSPDSIEAKIRALDGVNYAEVFENATLLVDSRGLPPKSFEVVVDGGIEAVIAATIYSEKPAGIETYGGSVVTTTDSDGETQTVRFTRPTTIDIHIDVSYTLYDEEVFPINGETLIKQALVEYGKSVVLGEDIIAQRMYGFVFGSIQGIQSLDISLGYTSGSITESVLPITEAEKGNILSSNISVGLGV